MAATNNFKVNKINFCLIPNINKLNNFFSFLSFLSGAVYKRGEKVRL